MSPNNVLITRQDIVKVRDQLACFDVDNLLKESSSSAVANCKYCTTVSVALLPCHDD